MFKKLMNVLVALWGWCVAFGIATELITKPVIHKIETTESVYYLNQSLAGVLIIASIAIVLILFALWLPGFKTAHQEEGKLAITSRKKKYIWLAGCILVMALLCVGCSQWYEVYTLEGVKIHHWKETKEYKWEDVSYYTLDIRGKTLSMKLYMKDGKNTDVFGGEWAVGTTSDKYAEQFPEDVYDYAIWLDEILKQQGTELRIKDREALKKKLTHRDYYVRQVAEKILK